MLSKTCCLFVCLFVRLFVCLSICMYAVCRLTCCVLIAQSSHSSFVLLPLFSPLPAVDVLMIMIRCKNFDGGFGAVPGAESHAGQIFCCVGALSIGQALHYVDEDLLGWWLSERQCDSGGLNGRPEKQADVCYSWWILSSLSILGRVCNVCFLSYYALFLSRVCC